MNPMKKMFGIILVLGLVVGSAIANSETAPASDAIKARIAPVGSVCMSGDDCAAAPAPAVAAGPKSGKDVYTGFCATCHGTGLMSAPKLGAAADWAPRAAKGLETLYTHAISGFNSMPPKGMCAACTDDEIKAAVDHMVESSK